jgi:hypothetical protein
LTSVTSLELPWRASSARPSISTTQLADELRELDTKELVLRIVRYDLKELELALRAELRRCCDAVGRVAADEARRVFRTGLESWLASRGNDTGGVAETHRWRFVGEQLATGALERTQALTRIREVLLEERVRVSELLGSYMHWRRPLLFYWAWHRLVDALRPLTPLLSPLSVLLPALAPTLARAATMLARARGRLPSAAGLPDALLAAPSGVSRQSGRLARWLSAGSLASLDLTEAILHLVPQIMAKLKHATLNEPRSLVTFVTVALRLLAIVPALTLCRLCGAEALRQLLLRMVLREALLASTLCNRVEQKRALRPLAPPGGWRTFGEELRDVVAAAAAHGARALAWSAHLATQGMVVAKAAPLPTAPPPITDLATLSPALYRWLEPIRAWSPAPVSYDYMSE